MIQIPQKAIVGKNIPKNRFIGKLKNKISEWIEGIIWLGKLSPESLNINKSEGVPEIEIIELRLKGKNIKSDIISGIDKSIPYPILFILHFEGKSKLMMSLKENAPNLYFSTEWSDKTNLSLPYAIDMEHLYHELLLNLIPLKHREEERIEEIVERYKTITKLNTESLKLQREVEREKQPNKRVALNSDLRKIKKQINLLK